jgi:hypothetical protein
MKHVDDLIFWVEEREHIRHQKDLGLPPPWTDDPIMASYRFCNVFREDDLVTQWIHKNWLYPNLNSPMLQFAMTMARMVNWPETLKDLGFPHIWYPDHFVMTIGARKISKMKCWTSAYMITGGYSEGGKSKEAIIADVLTQALATMDKDPIRVGDSLELASIKLRTPGIGTFLGGQIIADLKHSPLLAAAYDWHTWCAVGPGSTAGLNYLYDRNPATILAETQFRTEVLQIRELIAKETELKLDAQNTQNCLCEFSKYVRTKYYGRRPKTKYVARIDSSTGRLPDPELLPPYPLPAASA